MTKSDAIKLFGSRANDLAYAVSRKKSAISMWKNDLTNDQINLVIGAAVRNGIEIPDELMKKISITESAEKMMQVD